MMILHSETLASVIYVAFSIILLWITTVFMIDKKKMSLFTPIFILSILICFKAIFSLYKLTEAFYWISLEFITLGALFFILIFIWRKGR